MIRCIADFLCICAGFRRDALARAPHAGGSAATLGFVMILTALMASLTSGYALHRAFLGDYDSDPLAIIFGLIWGSFVFCLDRLLILCLDKFASPWQVALQVLIRLPLAMIVALVMSKPLILRLSEKVIDGQLRTEKRRTIEQEKDANLRDSGLNDSRKMVAGLDANRAKQESRLQGEPDSYQYNQAKKDLAEAQGKFQQISQTNGLKITRATREISHIQSDQQATTPEGYSNLRMLEAQVEAWRREVSQAKARVSECESRKLAAGQIWMKEQGSALGKLQNQLNEAVMEELKTSKDLARQDREVEDEIPRIMAPDLINQYRSFRRITSDPKHPDAAATQTFETALDLFFFILECTPILAKAFSKKGPLDYAMAAVEFMDQERINLEANGETAVRQKLMDARTAIREAAIDQWRDTHIKRIRSMSVSAADMKSILKNLDQMAA